MTVEDLTRRPPSGLSVIELAMAGSPKATEKVIEAAPELSEKPPSGLSLIKWAQIGLTSAQKRVLDIFNS